MAQERTMKYIKFIMKISQNIFILVKDTDIFKTNNCYSFQSVDTVFSKESISYRHMANTIWFQYRIRVMKRIGENFDISTTITIFCFCKQMIKRRDYNSIKSEAKLLQTIGRRRLWRSLCGILFFRRDTYLKLLALEK